MLILTKYFIDMVRYRLNAISLRHVIVLQWFLFLTHTQHTKVPNRFMFNKTILVFLVKILE